MLHNLDKRIMQAIVNQSNTAAVVVVYRNAEFVHLIKVLLSKIGYFTRQLKIQASYISSIYRTPLEFNPPL